MSIRKTEPKLCRGGCGQWIDPGKVKYCAECKSYYRRFSRWSTNGIDIPQAIRTLKAAGGKCVICGSKTKNIRLDHNHETGLIRGALCHRCNIGLGVFADNPSLLRAAAVYVDTSGQISEALTYDDVLLAPRLGILDSRDDASTKALLGGTALNAPILSAPMSSVTELDMAQAMADAGGMGIIHRFMPIQDQVAMVSKVNGLVGAAVGIADGLDRAGALLETGIHVIVVDVAHAHSLSTLHFVESLKTAYGPDVDLIVGSVATYQGARDVFSAGADVARVGIGSGAACSTRAATGVGQPQLLAVMAARRAAQEVGKFVVADGGIKTSGDMVKALAAGADCVMIGSLLAGCPEAPEPGLYYGEASEATNHSTEYVEGAVGTVPLTASATIMVRRWLAGIRSGISYCGARDLQGLRDSAEFLKVSPATYQIESAVRIEVD
jgi:IMP dehydrogenase